MQGNGQQEKSSVWCCCNCHHLAGESFLIKIISFVDILFGRAKNMYLEGFFKVYINRDSTRETYAGIFKQSMGARNRVGIGYRTGPPGNIGWRN
jgi:hypothetical protein